MQIKRAFKLICGASVLTFLMSQAMASGVAKMTGDSAGGDNITVEFLDKKNVRMLMDQDGYMLMSNGKSYMVSKADGETIVMDMRSLGNMAASMPVNDTDFLNQELISVKSLGRTETVAGIKGKVYLVTWLDSRGTHKEEAVFTTNSLAREFTVSWMSLSNSMLRALGKKINDEGSIWEYLNEEGLGILRMGREFRLTYLKSKSLSSSKFKLPARPMQMPDMGNVFSQMPKSAPASRPKPSYKKSSSSQSQRQYDPEPEVADIEEEPQEESGGLWGKFMDKVSNTSERQVDKTEQKTTDRIDRTVDQAIDKVLDKVFSW